MVSCTRIFHSGISPAGPWGRPLRFNGLNLPLFTCAKDPRIVDQGRGSMFIPPGPRSRSTVLNRPVIVGAQNICAVTRRAA